MFLPGVENTRPSVGLVASGLEAVNTLIYPYSGRAFGINI